ncbi:chromosome segregation protein SMC [Sphingorhabdus sp. Alg239-R122]|uniref:chromosome segregation protein SMC n=1 Tax=Sphingorhabdus sp. Alg239-R122 TaxID=2305989 RepID=UPI0013D9CEA5|nr:chromosome segregation protein SMC [Sphingorhabdus sp. Alg239-R122]
MQIKRLKLSGFKSFVDPTDLRIEKGLTGIVGPNGCGKSNLLEAIRWVMGENSPKSMRGGGMEDVIFAGTATRAERSFAEVSLLAETEKGEHIATIAGANDAADDDELEVIRRIERGAGSAYRVNGRDVRAKDIALIFADAATGAHSPALVSQGKIAAVIAAKPTERRQMLEEAAGIAGLHVRRKDAEQKLRAAEKNLERLDTILADMDARSAHLRRQAKAAERYKKLSAQIGITEARLVYARWRDAAAAAKAAKQEAEEAEARVTSARAAQQDAQQAQASAAQKLADARSVLQEKRDNVNSLSHQIEALQGQLDNIHQRITDLDRQSARLTDDSAREDQLTHDAAAALTRLEQEQARVAADTEKLESERPAQERAYDNAERAARANEVELAKAVAEQARVQAEIRVADAALSAAQTRTDRLTSDLERTQAQLREQAAPDVLEKQWTDAEARKTGAEKQLTEARGTLEKLEAGRIASTKARAVGEADLSSAKADSAALERELAALTRELAQQQGSGKALDDVSANKGYETALAAALGDDLSAAVGKADGDGRFWTGTAMDGDSSGNRIDASRLADHVSAPEALSSRLRHIWVMEKDDGAPLRLGERLVTLSGRLRRWDGFVSHGDGAATAERLARRTRLEELQKLVPAALTATEAAETVLTAHVEKLNAIQNDIRSARTAIDTASAEEREALRALDQCEYARRRARERRDELETQIKAVAGDREEAQAELDAARKTRAALPDGAKQQAETEKLQAQNDAARSAMQSAQAAVSALDQSLSQARERGAVISAEIKGWQARSSEAATRMADMAKRIEELAEERAVLAARPESLKEQVTAKTTRHSEEAASLETLENAAREAETELRAHETSLATTAEALSSAREERAGAVARAENQDLRRVEMARISGERFECPPPMLPEKMEFDADAIRDAAAESTEHERLNTARERIGPVNLVAADELEETQAEIDKGHAEHAELTEAINRLRGSIGSLNREGRTRLLDAFETVDQHFRKLFAELFNGGKAHLELVDSDDPLQAGLEIMAQPPGKRLSSLTLLSGGEQALTAVALIFALFLTNPAPICVLDEVDAPLDDANIERFCDLLDTMTRETNTRYLIVTHNAVTMSRMHRLFGVTMIEQGISRLVSVDLGGAEELLAAE